MSQDSSHEYPVDSECRDGHTTLDWGLTEYQEAWDRQMVLLQKRMTGEMGDTLVFTEHHPVFTMGIRKSAAEHLVWDESTAADHGVTLIKSNRGGDITYHGPGQVVGYPIISLENARDLHGYMRRLEEVLIRTVGTLGLAAGRRDGKTGIWLEKRKIAAIGVAVRRWYTYHGFALNVNNDLTPFSGIVPCGITDGSVTSLKQELGFSVAMDEVKQIISTEFWNIFGN